MKTVSKHLLRAIFKSEQGQMVAIWALVMPLFLLGMAGMVIDFGHVYVSFHQLQASADAAAMAGAWALPNTTATTQATTYSSAAGGKNPYPGLKNVQMASGFPMIRCLTTLKTQGIACSAPGNGNAVTVKEQADVPMWFSRLVGVNTIHIAASATASMNGGSAPFNVAIIVDTTASMATADANCGNVSRLTCALQGVQVLLNSLSPCLPSSPTCSVTNGVATNAVDQVSLFTFPNPTIGTVSKAYDCSSSNPTIQPYSFPTPGATTYAPTGSTTATYQVTGWLSDYRTSDTASSLNSTSILTQSVGGKSGCTGMGDPGGEGTYYAGVIYAAQAALVAAQAANPGSQNMMILLSDGDATASSSQMAATAANGTKLSNSGVYPSYVDECGQAIIAAQAATTAHTKVYTVAYGSASSGCATDTTAAAGWKGVTPCQTMENIASLPQYFFSDYNQSGSGSTCQSASQPTTNLNQIFQQIHDSGTTVARLIPDNTP